MKSFRLVPKLSQIRFYGSTTMTSKPKTSAFAQAEDLIDFINASPTRTYSFLLNAHTMI